MTTKARSQNDGSPASCGDVPRVWPSVIPSSFVNRLPSFGPFLLLLPVLLAFVIAASAQEDVPPSPKEAGVRLQFLPPPMEGTFSLGIYDAKDKLVRTLHREAKTDAFTIALNGLITHWNGKGDKGAPAAAGKYC